MKPRVTVNKTIQQTRNSTEKRTGEVENHVVGSGKMLFLAVGMKYET